MLYDPADVYAGSWHSPEIDIRRPFDLAVTIAPSLGPGGVLARVGDGRFSSLMTDVPHSDKADEWPEPWESSAEMQVNAASWRKRTTPVMMTRLV